MVAGRLVGRTPVVGQTVGGGELPGAGFLLAAKRLHLLPPSVLISAVRTQLFRCIKFQVTLLTPDFFFQFGSLQFVIRTTNTSYLKNNEVLVTS